jgi:hypothetical protein
VARRPERAEGPVAKQGTASWRCSRNGVWQALILQEIPQLCRGGGRSLTFPAVCAPAPCWHEENLRLGARPLILHKGRLASNLEVSPDRVIECPVASLYSWDVVEGWELGPLERSQL